MRAGTFASVAEPTEVARHLASFSMGMDTLAGLGLPNHSPDEMQARIEVAVDRLTARR